MKGDVKKTVERLLLKVRDLEAVARYQQAKIRQLEELLTAQGIEIDTAQLALLQWMHLGGEHWAALRRDAVALRTAGVAAGAFFAGWSEAFSHLVQPAAEVVEEDPGDEDESVLPTPIGGDNVGAVL